MDKYLLLVGKWGTYFAQCLPDGPRDLTNNDVLELLNKSSSEVPKFDSLHNHIYTNYSHKVDTSKPFIQVDCFKKSGKWVGTRYSNLIQSHVIDIEGNNGFVIAELFEKNDPSVFQYSPVTSGFKNLDCYEFHIDVYNVDGFCKYLIKGR